MTRLLVKATHHPSPIILFNTLLFNTRLTGALRGTHHSLYRLNLKTLRRLAALIPLPHRDVCSLEMPAEAVGVEQRVSRATPREPRSQFG